MFWFVLRSWIALQGQFLSHCKDHRMLIISCFQTLHSISQVNKQCTKAHLAALSLPLIMLMTSDFHFIFYLERFKIFSVLNKQHLCPLWPYNWPHSAQLWEAVLSAFRSATAHLLWQFSFLLNAVSILTKALFTFLGWTLCICTVTICKNNTHCVFFFRHDVQACKHEVFTFVLLWKACTCSKCPLFLFVFI